MAVIPFPSCVLNLASFSPNKITPAQINRSAWTGRSKILGLAGIEYWTARAVFRVLPREDNVRHARAFFASLRGQINTFDLPVLQTPQIIPTLSASGFQNLRDMTITNISGDLWNLQATVANAYAASLSQLTGDFTLRWQLVNGVVVSYSVGVTPAPVAGGSYDYGVSADGANTYTYSGGTQSLAGVPFSPDGKDWHFLSRRNGTMTYHKGRSPDVNLADVVFVYPVVVTAVEKVQVILATLGQLNIQADFDVPQPTVSVAAGAGTGVAQITPESRIRPGHYMTITLPSGHHRLVELAQVYGSSVLYIEPRLPEALVIGNQIDLKRPHMRVRLSSPETTFEDSNGVAVFSCDVEEAL